MTQLELFPEFEDYEDDTETGPCYACKEHATPLYQRSVYTGELSEPLSNCCGAAIWLP